MHIIQLVKYVSQGSKGQYGKSTFLFLDIKNIMLLTFPCRYHISMYNFEMCFWFFLAGNYIKKHALAEGFTNLTDKTHDIAV